MKTTILTSVFTLILSASTLFASNENNEAVSREMISSVSISLSPTTPTEATFEDTTETVFTNVSELAPVNPDEADFSDVAPELAVCFSALAPTTPTIADFSDSEIQTIEIKTLAPATPAVAGFE
jgi:hypothetical protein